MGIPFLPRYPHIQIVITFTTGNRRHGMMHVFTIQMLIPNAVTFLPGHVVFPTLLASIKTLGFPHRPEVSL